MMTETMVIQSSAPKTKEAKPQNKKKTKENAFDQVIAQMSNGVVAQTNPTLKGNEPQQLNAVELQPLKVTEPQLLKVENESIINVPLQQPQSNQLNLNVPMEQVLMGQNPDTFSEQMESLFVEQPVEGVQLNQQGSIPVVNMQEVQQQIPVVLGNSNAVNKENLSAQTKQAMSNIENSVKLDAEALNDVAENKIVDVQEQNSQTQEFELGRSFREAVQLIQQSAKKEKTEETEVFDVDTLQAHVDVQRNKLEGHLKMQQLQGNKPVQAENVSKQVSEKMLLQLQKGEREFTIKLNPESLGEVTVKLLQKDGKMTLSLAAASETTVKLLNGQLEALKQAVRPMQVEVRQAVVQTQESDSQNMGQQMDMSNGGQFFNQSKQAQEQFYGQNKGSSNNVRFSLDGITEELASPEQVQQAATIITNNLLDLYL